MARRYVSSLMSGDTAALLAQRPELRVEAGTDPTALAAMRASTTWYAPEDLPNCAGVYVIASGDQITGDASTGLTYIGCAKNVHARFHRADYGHLRRNSTRSAAVLADGNARFGVVAVAAPADDEQLNRQIATLEVFWYLLALRAGLQVVNSVGNLGRTSEGAHQWLFVSAVDGSGDHIFRSQNEASRVLGILQGTLSNVVRAVQNQATGWTLRPAAPEEVARFEAGHRPEDCVSGEPEIAWVGGRMFWSGGPLRQEDRARLSARARSSYDRTARSRFWGVRRAPRRGTWEAYVVTDPTARSNWRSLGRNFPTEEAAAAAREAALDADPELAARNKRNDPAGRAWGETPDSGSPDAHSSSAA